MIKYFLIHIIMIKHLYIIASLMLFLFVGCTKEEDVDGDYKYEKQIR